MTFPPIGYTIRHEQNGDRMFYRAMRVSGTEWVSPLLRAIYEAALRDAEEHARKVQPMPNEDIMPPSMRKCGAR
jgi:hypothetical protein